MKKQKIYGRQAELTLLDNYYNKLSSCFIAIYGRRRIGKSYLVNTFAEGKPFYKFIGLAPDQHTSAEDQKAAFRHSLEGYGVPCAGVEDWLDLFRLLALKVEGKKAIIFLDEISWMASGDHTFLPKLKTAWDEYLKLQSNVQFIICGSVSSWIEKNVLSSTAFVGRVDHVISLKALSLSACNAFWPNKNISAYEKFKVLSITGGVPLYLQSFDLNCSFEQNMERLCLSSGGLLLREFEVIFHDLFNRKASIYKDIVMALVKGPLDAKNISKAIDWSQSGVLTDYLNDLLTAGFISRDYVWQFKTGEVSKNSRFRLSDNYLRFYLRCLQKHKAKIEQQTVAKPNIAQISNIDSILGLQFENLVLANRELILEALGIRPEDVVFENPYFQKAGKTQSGCQIDYLIQTRFNGLFICEIKFTKSLVRHTVIKEVQNKIDTLKKPRNFSCFPVLIHMGDIEERILEEDYFMKVINFSEFLEGATNES